jgi:hypothetical protein
MRKKGPEQRQVCRQICISARRNNDFTLWYRKSNPPLHKPCGHDSSDAHLKGEWPHSAFPSEPRCR